MLLGDDDGAYYRGEFSAPAPAAREAD